MSESSSSTRALSMQGEWETMVRGPYLGLLLDFDGTLVDFAPTLAEATLDVEAIALLERLHAVGVQVTVVSGRPRASIDTLRARLPSAWWLAEHGSWRTTGGAWEEVPAVADLSDLEARLGGLAAAVDGARVERKNLSIAIHWRQVAESARGSMITAAEVISDEWLETQPEFERLDGAMVLEVRHRSANKGSSVPWVRARLPAGTPLLAIGDDVTDEDTFAALDAGDFAVGVGEGAAQRGHAAWWIATPSDTRRLLTWIAETRAVASAPRPVPIHYLADRRHVAPRSCELLIVSNRLPAADIGRAREVGGLVSALRPVVADRRGVWLGWSGHEREPGLALTIEADGAGTRAVFDYPMGWREPFYAGFCNQSLWPLMHCFPGRVRYSSDEWVAYVAANEAYARLAASLAAPGGTIWIHDFHLMLVGAALRHLGHQGPIGFFLHVPFPPRDVWETLPWSDEIMDAMLSFDLVGLHAQRWAENFVVAATTSQATSTSRPGTLRKGTRTTSVEVFPMGIDAGAFAPTGTDEPPPDVEGLRAGLADRKLILGVDRLDYSKGIPERLEAFRMLLLEHPVWRGRVSFIQVSVPSRAEVPEYAALRRRVEELVGRINGELGEANWVPVRYLYRSYTPDVLAYLYRLADVAMVTPLRDGMNLVAKEFVAAQDSRDPGVLLLSKFAGAAAELDAALLTNPYHADGVASDLDRALRMPLDERRRRHGDLLRATLRTSATGWADSFLERLTACAAAPASREESR